MRNALAASLVALCLCLSACESNKPGAATVNAQASRATPSPRSTPLSRSEPKAIEPDNARYFHGYR